MSRGSGAEHNPKEMGFLEHLEELRWVLIRSGIALVVLAVIMFNFSGWLFDTIIIRPLDSQFPGMELIFLKPAGNLMAMMNISLWAAFILGLPYVAWEIWRFVIPGLFQHERRLMPILLGVTILCFSAGAAMAYFIIIPYALHFFLTFGAEMAVPQIEIKEYISFVLRMILVFGVIFELPVISFILARVGLITPKLLKNIRAYAIFVIALLSALITPQDPLTMIMAMVPLIILYEVSILVAWAGKRRHESGNGDEDPAIATD
ncbi:twin-arginine translocase subunit TatC [Gemmatimonadota bacterium]